MARLDPRWPNFWLSSSPADQVDARYIDNHRGVILVVASVETRDMGNMLFVTFVEKSGRSSLGWAAAGDLLRVNS